MACSAWHLGELEVWIPMKEDPWQQSPQLLGASCSTGGETRALGSEISFNSALILKILLTYSSRQTSGWQFPSPLGQCCIVARKNLAPRCRRVRWKGWTPVRELIRCFPSSRFPKSWAQRMQPHQQLPPSSSPSKLLGRYVSRKKNAQVKQSAWCSSCVPVQFSSLLLDLTCVYYV